MGERGAAAGACSYSLMELYCGLLEVLTELVCCCENRCVNNPQNCTGETQNSFSCHLMYSRSTETAVLLHYGPRLQFSIHCYAFGSNRSVLSQHPDIGILGGFSNRSRLLFIVRKQVFKGLYGLQHECDKWLRSHFNTQWLTINVYVSRPTRGQVTCISYHLISVFG